MGKASRNKGKVGERELAAFLREHGREARRGVQYMGGPQSPDVVSDLRGVHLECKRTEQLRLYPALEQAATEKPAGSIPVVAHRRNRKPWVAVLPLESLLLILKEAGR